MTRKIKWIYIVIPVLIIVGGIGGYRYVDYHRTLATYRQMIADITIDEVDLSKIEDGIYTGTHDAIWVGADVTVTVKDHRITNIKLERHLNGHGEPAEVIPQKVIETQSLKVDTISGVTSSSKVILKAIEKALLNPPECLHK
ncbi:MAG: FMN-binding protein [Anaerosolibacter sp.]|uniref:FMN-binding protein n=1 Tax=Anaerosolibacter sp. TaxID=1872527 RepID=UPI00260BF563|nr:FMN-binding protein [Anaerosolibacter sp.]MDF2546008.1 FMN-binding protein [Anaerosolibacter sp.]